jgi:DMSO reductase anchor subunit
MFAYLLLLVAVASRLLPHAGWFNFTAVGGTLLYFGARRPWREMLVPLAALMATDYCLTAYVYHYSFRWEGYVTTWAWYLAAMALGQILLSARVSFARVAAGALLGPSSFFVVSNYGVWASGFNGYPHTLAGLQVCYLAAVPFYRNDLLSTALVLAVAFGVPALARRMNLAPARAALAGK